MTNEKNEPVTCVCGLKPDCHRDKGRLRVECSDYMCGLNSQSGSTPEEAIEAWNTLCAEIEVGRAMLKGAANIMGEYELDSQRDFRWNLSDDPCLHIPIRPIPKKAPSFEQVVADAKRSAQAEIAAWQVATANHLCWKCGSPRQKQGDVTFDGAGRSYQKYVCPNGCPSAAPGATEEGGTDG